MATDLLIQPTDCDCAYWRENMPKLNGPIILQSVRTGGAYQYDGKPFVFCPWCGTGLPTPQTV